MRGSIRVVLDTNVLYGQFSRYLLLSLSLQGVLLPFWSPAILDELTEVLLRHGFDPEAVAYQRLKLEADWPEALVTAPLPSAPGDLKLPDPDDWPVIATAIVAQASAIVTWNLHDFPDAVLGPYGLVARTPDRWCADRLVTLQNAGPQVGAAEDVYAGLRGHLATLNRPLPWTAARYREMLRREGYRRFEALIPPDVL